MMNKIVPAVLGLACALPAAAQQPHSDNNETGRAPVTVLAAGSLREVLTDLGAAYRQATGTDVAIAYGPSGKLRGEIEHGRPVDVFASAATEHTETLAASGILAGSTVFAWNNLCVVARPGLGVDERNLLDVLLAPSVRLATSTPVSDPMGDYTWQFFRKADGRRPGAYKVLDAKALKLSGAGAPAPGAAPPYVTAFADDKADAYVMYCTNAASTRRVLPQLAVVRMPDGLNVRSAYGIGARTGSAAGARFVAFVLGDAGRRILHVHGFD